MCRARQSGCQHQLAAAAVVVVQALTCPAAQLGLRASHAVEPAAAALSVPAPSPVSRPSTEMWTLGLPSASLCKWSACCRWVCFPSPPPTPLGLMPVVWCPTLWHGAGRCAYPCDMVWVLVPPPSPPPLDLPSPTLAPPRLAVTWCRGGVPAPLTWSLLYEISRKGSVIGETSK